jgi:hypothetical protein
MAQPTTLVPLADMLELLSQARERIAAGAPGLKATYNSVSAAKNQWFRLGATMRRLQERSKEIYEPADHRYGRSGYEDLAFYPEGPCLIIRPASIPRNIITIEDLEL